MELMDQLKKITVTILLVILTLSALSLTATFTPAKAAEYDNVQVVSYSWYTYPPSTYTTGDIIVVGEIQNVGTTTLDVVYVQALVYTDDGQAQAEKEVQVFGEDILPQQKAPFYMDVYDADAFDGNMSWMYMVDHIEFSILYAGNTTDQQFAGLQIVTSSSSIDESLGNVFTVTGLIENSGTEPSPNRVWVVTTFYDDTGTVVGVNKPATPYIQTAMSPGETMPFIAQPQDYAQIERQITSYSVSIQSREQVTITPSPSPSSSATATASPTSSSSSPTQSPESQQSSPSSDWIYIVAVAVVVVIIVAGMLVVSKRKK
jgi:cell division septation protein DedD